MAANTSATRSKARHRPSASSGTTAYTFRTAATGPAPSNNEARSTICGLPEARLAPAGGMRDTTKQAQVLRRSSGCGGRESYPDPRRHRLGQPSERDEREYGRRQPREMERLPVCDEGRIPWASAVQERTGPSSIEDGVTARQRAWSNDLGVDQKEPDRQPEPRQRACQSRRLHGYCATTSKGQVCSQPCHSLRIQKMTPSHSKPSFIESPAE